MTREHTITRKIVEIAAPKAKRPINHPWIAKNGKQREYLKSFRKTGPAGRVNKKEK